jgi:hypothetical protein
MNTLRKFFRQNSAWVIAGAIVLILIVAVIYGTARADPHPHDGGFDDDGGSNDAAVTATTTATIDQTQEQTQGNTQAVTFTSPDNVTIKNVPAVFAPNTYPTAPCRVSGSGGFAIAGFGASGGGSREDKECTRRETARMFWSFGQQEAALTLLCLSEVALKELETQCAAMVPRLRCCEATNGGK